jgi:hypothetical protein
MGVKSRSLSVCLIAFIVGASLGSITYAAERPASGNPTVSANIKATANVKANVNTTVNKSITANIKENKPQGALSVGLSPFFYNGNFSLGYNADYTILSKNGDSLKLGYLTGGGLTTSPDKFSMVALTYNIPIPLAPFAYFGIGLGLYDVSNSEKPNRGLSLIIPLEYGMIWKLTNNIILKSQLFLSSVNVGYSINIGVLL